jgi:O-antigen/teichoic acid export membrane protein
MKEPALSVSAALPRDGAFLRSVAVIAGGAAGAQMLSVFAVPVLTRLYRPDAFGLLAIFVGTVSLLVPALSLRFELAIPLAPTDAEKYALAATSLLATACTTTLVVIASSAALLTSHPPALLRSLAPHLPLLALSLVGGGAYQTLASLAAAEHRFTGVARGRLAQSVVQLSVHLSAGLFNFGATGLVAGDAAGRCLSCVPLLGRRDRITTERIRTVWTDIRAVVVRYRRFSLLSSGSALLNGAGLYLPPIVFTSLFGATPGGLFGLSQRVAAIPMGLIGTAVAQVYIGHAGPLVARDPTASFDLYRSVRRRLLLIGIPGAALLAFGGQAFAYVFGDEWREAGVYCQLLAPALLAQFVGSPLSQTLTLLNRLALQIILDASRAALLVAAIVIPHAFGSSARFALVTLSLTTAAHYSLLLFVTNRVFSRVAADHGSKGTV